MRVPRVVIALLWTVMLVGGCTGGNEPSSASKPSASPARIFTGTPNTLGVQGCKPENGGCWLPIQGRRIVVPREAINFGGPCTVEAEAQCWPQPAYADRPGDPFEVICATVGLPPNGSQSWYQVRVPAAHVHTPSLGIAQPDGSHLGYVRADFVLGVNYQQVPQCTE